MKQITEDYISFEVAKLLKEKGFDIPTKHFYDSTGENLEDTKIFYGGIPDFKEFNWNDDPFVSVGFPKFITFSKPTQSLALKWLREVHDLHIIVYPWQADNEEKAIHWCCTVYKSFAHLGNDVYTNETPKSYEQAIEAALNYVLKNLI